MSIANVNTVATVVSNSYNALDNAETVLSNALANAHNNSSPNTEAVLQAAKDAVSAQKVALLPIMQVWNDAAHAAGL